MPRPRSRHRVARADRAQPDQAGRPAGQLPGPEALVGDGAVLVDLARADVGVGGHHAAGGGEEQRHGQLGHGVGVATRGTEHGYPGRGGRRPRRRWSGRPGSCTRPAGAARRVVRHTGRSRRRRSRRPLRPPARPAARRCRCAGWAGRATSRGSGRPARRGGRGPVRGRPLSPTPCGRSSGMVVLTPRSGSGSPGGWHRPWAGSRP